MSLQFLEGFQKGRISSEESVLSILAQLNTADAGGILGLMPSQMLSLCHCSPHPSSLALHCIYKCTILQGVGQELVHLSDLGRDSQVDRPVANLNDESSNNFRVDLCLLASA